MSRHGRQLSPGCLPCASATAPGCRSAGPLSGQRPAGGSLGGLPGLHVRQEPHPTTGQRRPCGKPLSSGHVVDGLPADPPSLGELLGSDNVRYSGGHDENPTIPTTNLTNVKWTCRVDACARHLTVQCIA